ncbi:MAG: aldehyde dehydrogenase family protein [Actinobacteria bacterium]|nr:aldehyde dehydrogenase family protein [Actinomycetota bacterium]
MAAFKNLIGGAWVGASDRATFETRNPARAGDVLGTFPNATSADAAQAVAAAAEAFPAWAATPAPARGAVLFRAAELLDERLDDVSTTLTREEGKTLTEAKGEVTRARDILRYFGGEGWRVGGEVLPPNTPHAVLFSRREPLGVVAAITPWNFPIAIPAWKLAPALVYGNTVVFKPASATPLTALRLVECLVDAGLPAGVLNFVTGSGATVGGALAGDSIVRGLTFTGAHAAGAQIYARATQHFARVQLEMGGKNPIIVLDDADLELAVRLAVMGGFGLTGQSCTATSRVIVEEGIADRFAAALAEAAAALRVGDGLVEGVQMGPAVSAEQLATDLEYMQIAGDEGAELLTGGGPAAAGGHFVQPTVFDRVEVHSRLAQEEVFGPVVGIIRARDLEDALFKANAVGYGLAAGVVTNDLRRALTFVDRIEAGVVKVNEPTTGLALQAPFGGFKLSSANTFKEQGPAAVEFFTRTKTVYISY